MNGFCGCTRLRSWPLAWTLVVASLVPNASPTRAQGRLQVVASLPDFESIAVEVGGDEVSTFSIATGFQNPHFVDPKPSYILKLSRADVFITGGLDLEIGWVPPLLQSARNKDILMGGSGYVDASKGVSLLQVPSSVSREQGDIHAYGNPHYWLDPDQGRLIAQNVYAVLSQLRPEKESLFAANLERFNRRLDEKMDEWASILEPYRGARVIAYHNEWPYFESRFGFEIVDFLEPKPGIPPTPSQLAKVIRLMQEDDITVIITSPYFRRDAADLVADKVGGTVVILATSVGAKPEIRSYFDLFDHNVGMLVDALRGPQ